MGIFKKLASQTAIYGLSSIFGRFLNYLLVPLYTYYFSAAEYGVVSEFYAYAGFFSVFLLFGFETGYFRFRDKENPQHDKTYSTALIFIVLVNIGFFALILLLNSKLSAALNYANHPEYVRWFSIILILDAIGSIPFARLRAENKAFRFAGIKVIEILTTIALSLLFIVYCPKLAAQNLYPEINLIYQPEIGVGYIFIANLIASLVKFLLLTPQLKGLGWGFDWILFKKLLRYCLPMVVIGFAGIINEMLDRALLKYLLPYDTQTNLKMLGIYGACYKLSILMSLFIQAFRYAAEPFFFAYSDKSDATKVYAHVLKFFVIFCVFIFLLVTLYIDFFKYFIGKEFRAGLQVVPILLMANLCLGIYVNLSIWYKLTDKTGMGAIVSLSGALLTIILNLYWIPLYGYVGSAWATLACYASMAIVSYLLGRKYYPVAYEVVRILSYIGLGIGLYVANQQLIGFIDWQPWIFASVLMFVYLLITILFEGRKIQLTGHGERLSNSMYTMFSVKLLPMYDLINKPKYIFGAYICLILGFAVTYWMLPIPTFEKTLSFPQSFYLSVVTITTLGYGDITPKSIPGMLAVSLEAILGILIIGFYINSIWKKQLDKIEKDQRSKIEESIQELNRNKLSSYSIYLKSIIYEYKKSAIDVTTPMGSRQTKDVFDYNFKFSDFRNIFDHSLLIKYASDKSVIEIYYDKEQDLIAELKYLLANFNLEKNQELRNKIINFLHASYAYNLRDILCSYSKMSWNEEPRKMVVDMIKKFDELPPKEYHVSNILTPVIFLYQTLPEKMKILEEIENGLKM